MEARIVRESMRILVLTLLIVAFSWTRAVGQEESGGTTSPFELGAGSRIISMGGAASAVGEDSYVMLWNPAGLFQIDRSEADLFHTSLFDESVTYSALLLSYPFVDLGVVSLAAVQLRIGGIDRRDGENQEIGGDLDNSQTRYIIGYARNIYRGLAGGINLKIDRFIQGSYVANGFGLDVGIGARTDMRSPVVDGVSFGASVANVLEPGITLASEEVGDPLRFRFGFAAWRCIAGDRGDRLMIAFDLDKSRYSDVGIHAGCEYILMDIFAVRGGWDAGIPTFGCGLARGFLGFDYAYRDTDLGGNHLFSLTYRFGPSRSEKLEERQRKRDEQIQRELDSKIGEFEERFIGAEIENGDSHLERGDYRRAAENFNRVLLWSPDHEQARRSLALARASLLVQTGDSLMNEGKGVEALFVYRNALEILPQEQIAIKITDCEQQIGETADKVRIVENMFARSLDYYTNRQWDEAMSGFEQVLELAPGHALATEYVDKTGRKIQKEYERMLARVDRLSTEKRYAAAIEELRLGMKRYPGDPVIAARLETVEAQRNADAERERAAVTEQIRTARTSVADEKLRPAYERGVEYFGLGNFRGAIGEWERIWKDNPRFENVADYLIKAYQYRGMELYANHAYEDALEMWERILLVDPDNAKAHRYIKRTKEELSSLEGLIE